MPPTPNEKFGISSPSVIYLSNASNLNAFQITISLGQPVAEACRRSRMPVFHSATFWWCLKCESLPENLLLPVSLGMCVCHPFTLAGPAAAQMTDWSGAATAEGSLSALTLARRFLLLVPVKPDQSGRQSVPRQAGEGRQLSTRCLGSGVAGLTVFQLMGERGIEGERERERGWGWFHALTSL